MNSLFTRLPASGSRGTLGASCSEPFCPMKLRTPSSSTDERREREAEKYAFFSGLSYNGDTRLLRKISSNYYFLNSIVIILTISLQLLLNGLSCMQVHTKISQLLLCLRASLEVPFRLHCRFSRLEHSVIIPYHKHFPISLTLH